MYTNNIEEKRIKLRQKTQTHIITNIHIYIA